jgi:hypothetical protein
MAFLGGSVWAATPSSGTVSQASTQATWKGGPRLATASATCGGPANASCDNYKLTVTPPSYAFKLEIRLTAGPLDDYDLEVYGPNGALLGSSTSNPGAVEKVEVDNPAAGVYTVSAVPFATVTAYSATAKIIEAPAPPPPSTEPAPTYSIHTPPAGLGQSAGEPTLGVNEQTGAVMYIAGTETLKVDFDDCSSPATAAWQDVSALWTSQITFDPLLFTDQELGRTFVSQLLPTKISLMAYSDDDGASWWPSQGAGINSGVDHQSLGGGPFAPGLLQPLTDYPHIVYYCSQDVALAQCAASLDGGRTFGLAMPIYNITQCGGLHGHIKVGPDGTAYVPNKNCGGEQGVSVSRDNGLTWTVKTVPGSSAGSWDPSVGISQDGTVYFGWVGGDGHPYIAVSSDEGDTWSAPQDVGTAFGIENIAFPVVVAGDGDRAAFAFLGTTAVGDVGGEDPNLPAVWYLYVAHTYDGGFSWTTVDATPGDPVQRGTICSAGTTCGSTRNLLDFNDVTLDAQGRVLVGYADGCIGGCVNGGPNSGTELGSIARQSSGKGLYAAFDHAVGAPAAPAVQATQADGVIRVAWSTPDNRGSAITGYRLYRSVNGGSFQLLASPGASVNSYDDPAPAAGTAHSYKVTAVNAAGEGASCREASPVAGPSKGQTCAAPGARLADDPTGDSPVAALDIQSVSVAEPPSSDGSIVFTLKVADLSSFTPGNTWAILWNRPAPDAAYDRNFVSMRATGPGTAEFHYGKVAPPNTNQGTDLGTAAGTFAPDGTITFTITPGQADDVAVGQDLSALEARTFVANASGLPVTQLVSADFTVAGNHTLAGSAHCAPVNGGPDAQDDNAATVDNKPVRIEVLGNDGDPDGDTLTVTDIGPARNGRVTGKKDGGVTYKPNSGFTGTDSFIYTVTDGNGHTDTATVTVNVSSR